MKLKLIIIIFFFFLLEYQFVFAEEVTIKNAKITAKNFYYERVNLFSEINYGEIAFGKMYVVNQSTIPVYYIFNINKGFVVIAADDNVYPILCYSLKSNYSGKNMPLAFTNWMNNCKEQIIFIKEKNLPGTVEIESIWKKYGSEKFVPDKGIQSIEPLLNTTWSQGCFYNAFCPYDTLGPCEHVWTGCVATAMGQIMKYYNYPSHGTGSHGYYSNYGYLEVNFGNTSYNWAEMPYNLSCDNNATATLLYHCGVSINTIYGSAGSGAYDFDARDALVDYFDYSPDAQFFERDNYILDWEVLLISELEAGRPIIYGGVGSKYYGHTFICDGYQDTAFFHFNWGWGGIYDGYFFTDNLNPGGYNFSLFQDVVVGIQPNSPPDTYPPHSLNAVVDTNSVHLSWLPPYYNDKISDLLGYNIFRDGNIVNPVIITDLFYDDLNLYPGIYEYTVKAVYIGGESEQTDPFEVEIDWIGINKFFNSEILNIYPNPTSDYINIEFENTYLKNFQIIIYNLNGEVILIINENDPNSRKFHLDLSGFAQGIYYFYIQTEDKLFSRKIVVVK